MPDLSETSFYGGTKTSLQGPPGEPGPQGPQGPAGPQIPLPTFADNAAALAAERPLGSMYATPTGEVRVVI
jgi:hypothetical protein